MNGEEQEFYAASVQEAIVKASASLGVPPEQLQYSVVDEGSSGFLGIGTRDARIAVAVPESPSPSVPVTDTDPTTSAVPTEEPFKAEQPPPPHYPETVAPATPPAENPVPQEVEDQPSSDEEAPEDLILAIDGFAIELLEKMGFDATVDAYDADEVIKVDVSTGETGLLIGQKGETIDAIQYLLNVVVYRDRPFLKRITVDTEGYRQRRVEALQGMAHRTARRAQGEQRPVDLPPMAAAERRVVHLYLKENPNVSTSSEGGEEDRRVVITPNT